MVHASGMDPLHATIEEFAAEGFTHVQCYCPRCRVELRLNAALPTNPTAIANASTRKSDTRACRPGIQICITSITNVKALGRQALLQSGLYCGMLHIVGKNCNGPKVCRYDRECGN